MPKKEKLILLIFNTLVILFVFISFVYLKDFVNAAIILMGCTIGINIGRFVKHRKMINTRMVYIFLIIVSISLILFVVSFFKNSPFYLYSSLFFLFIGVLSFFNILRISK